MTICHWLFTAASDAAIPQRKRGKYCGVKKYVFFPGRSIERVLYETCCLRVVGGDATECPRCHLPFGPNKTRNGEAEGDEGQEQ